MFGGSYGWSSAGRLHHAKTQLNHFLACAGGYSGQVSNYSYGAAERLLPHVLGDTAPVTGQVATWDDIAAHTDTVLMLGGFPAKNVQLESGGTGDHTARLGLARALDARHPGRQRQPGPQRRPRPPRRRPGSRCVPAATPRSCWP